jgi:hypothetical protein
MNVLPASLVAQVMCPFGSTCRKRAVPAVTVNVPPKAPVVGEEKVPVNLKVLWTVPLAKNQVKGPCALARFGGERVSV